jgi:hypothetical protein
MQTQSAHKGSRVTKQGVEAFLDWLEAHGLSTPEVWLANEQDFLLHRPEIHPLPRHEQPGAEESWPDELPARSPSRIL